MPALLADIPIRHKSPRVLRANIQLFVSRRCSLPSASEDSRYRENTAQRPGYAYHVIGDHNSGQAGQHWMPSSQNHRGSWYQAPIYNQREGVAPGTSSHSRSFIFVSQAVRGGLVSLVSFIPHTASLGSQCVQGEGAIVSTGTHAPPSFTRRPSCPSSFTPLHHAPTPASASPQSSEAPAPSPDPTLTNLQLATDTPN